MNDTPPPYRNASDRPGRINAESLFFHIMQHGSLTPFLRTLCTLRWVAVTTQTATLCAAWGVGVSLPWRTLVPAIALLAGFNLYALWRCRHTAAVREAEAFAHILLDVAVLTWTIGCSGGVSNPFGPLFLLPVALSALAMPLHWTFGITAACVAGYALTWWIDRPLPPLSVGQIDLHPWGMAANFVLSVGVIVYFSTRLIAERERREHELSILRERFTRDEGIVALATHAASVAHELNTPLATLMMLVDELEAQPGKADAEDLASMRQLLALCRERVRALARPADPGQSDGLELGRVLTQWQLVRPGIALERCGNAADTLIIDRDIGHLLLVLLNNAADASASTGQNRVVLDIHLKHGTLYGEIRDYGTGFTDTHLLPALFDSSKPDGLGVGLALSHATIERLGGQLSITSLPDGARVRFEVPHSDHREQNGEQA